MAKFVTDAARSERMRNQRCRDTSPELLVRRALHALGYRYYVHRRPLPKLRRTADILFTRARLAVFIDGCFWHGCPTHGNIPRPNEWYWPEKLSRNRARDEETDGLLRAAGWTVLRLWEHEDPTVAADMIARALDGLAYHSATTAAGEDGRGAAARRPRP